MITNKFQISALDLSRIDHTDPDNYYETRYQTAVAAAKAAGDAYSVATDDPADPESWSVAAVTYSTAVMLAVHASCMVESWEHPALWVSGDPEEIDNELWVAVHNDGSYMYQGEDVEYFRIEGNSVSMKS